MLVLLLVTHFRYPPGSALARYDSMVLAEPAAQVAMLATGLEAREEAKVIPLFHLADTAMEVFKTVVGSWLYLEPGLLRVGGKLLFTGFMNVAVDSYLARAWRVFACHVVRHPPVGLLGQAPGTYMNSLPTIGCRICGQGCSPPR